MRKKRCAACTSTTDAHVGRAGRIHEIPPHEDAEVSTPGGNAAGRV